MGVHVAAPSRSSGLIAGLAAGLGVGLLNGWIVVRFGIPSLVADDRHVVLLGGDRPRRHRRRGRGDRSRRLRARTLLTGRIGGYVPAEIALDVGFAVVLWVVLNRQRFGAHVYLVGDNDQSARMMGVRSDRVAWRLRARRRGGRLRRNLVDARGPLLLADGGHGAMLPTVAAVFLGGTSIFGGRGTIFGTFVAAFVSARSSPGSSRSAWTGFSPR